MARVNSRSEQGEASALASDHPDCLIGLSVARAPTPSICRPPSWPGHRISHWWGCRWRVTSVLLRSTPTVSSARSGFHDRRPRNPPQRSKFGNATDGVRQSPLTTPSQYQRRPILPPVVASSACRSLALRSGSGFRFDLPHFRSKRLNVKAAFCFPTHEASRNGHERSIG